MQMAGIVAETPIIWQDILKSYVTNGPQLLSELKCSPWVASSTYRVQLLLIGSSLNTEH